MNNQLTDDELQQLIWGLKRYALHPRTLAGLQELQERRKVAGFTQNDSTHGLVTVDSDINYVVAPNKLTITLPDISSKAFWSGTGKHEVFHPETYKRWVKEAIERDCTIAKIEVKVK